jgi:hypothetical protein
LTDVTLDRSARGLSKGCVHSSVADFAYGEEAAEQKYFLNF